MTRSRTLGRLAVGLATLALAVAATASPANALVRAGVDGIWVPLSADRVKTKDQVLASTHRASSFGASAHANIGFEVFSVGLKVNYFNEGLTVENLDKLGSTDKVRRSQVDVNLMGRLGVPFTKVAAIGEAGVSVSTKFNGVGYNMGLGAEYRLFKLPLMKVHLGLEGQYVNFPATLKGTSTNNQSARLLLYLGADFGT